MNKSTKPYHCRYSSSIYRQSDDYTADETEFIMTIDRYKLRHRLVFLSWSEALGVLKSLGYYKRNEADGIFPIAARNTCQEWSFSLCDI